MNRIELKEKLEFLGINEHFYDLYGNLNSDSVILYQSYNEWQVFYLDERGKRNNIKIFKTEDQACLYILELFRESNRITNKFGLNM
ncbi:MAG TPA: hypothetical protein DCS36_04825 [Sphingobacterium sp.]|uniref:hypothetical protein n=1 Tax=Sphingobacterium multivorum TaxID=28454 RepID=UPI000E8EC182|nr:hypothetical protein [Sphingobacterium sp.]HAT91720.1 hypothetical protein [Sphingobacterium sp.]